MPGLTFPNAFLCIPGTVREVLKRRQREVGRQALRCHKMVANEGVKGVLGGRPSRPGKQPARLPMTAVSASRIAAGGPEDYVYTYMTGV